MTEERRLLTMRPFNPKDKELVVFSLSSLGSGHVTTTDAASSRSNGRKKGMMNLTFSIGGASTLKISPSPQKGMPKGKQAGSKAPIKPVNQQGVGAKSGVQPKVPGRPPRISRALWAFAVKNDPKLVQQIRSNPDKYYGLQKPPLGKKPIKGDKSSNSKEDAKRLPKRENPKRKRNAREEGLRSAKDDLNVVQAGSFHSNHSEGANNLDPIYYYPNAQDFYESYYSH